LSEDVTLELVNAKHDLADFFIDLRDKAEKWGRSPQGSACLYQSNLQENVDAFKACIHKLVIPPNSKVNHIRIWCYGEKYRTYETGAAAGGGTVVSSETTTPPVTTSGASNPNTTANAAPPSETSGPSSPDTSLAESAHSHNIKVVPTSNPATISSNRPDAYIEFWADPGEWYLPAGINVIVEVPNAAHSHDLASHTHIVFGTVHQHGMVHTHTVAHTAHTHDVTYPDHTHSIVFGIYEAASATAQISLVIKDPDGNDHNVGVLGSGEFAKEDLEVTEYFSKTGVYTLTFSADALGRVRSIVFAQVYLEPD